MATAIHGEHLKMSVSGVPTLSVSPLAPVLSHDHTVQFYAEDAYLLDELCRYIGTALVAGESAIVLATKEPSLKDWQEFKSRGVDTSKACEQGRYLSLDALKRWPNSWWTAGPMRPGLNSSSALSWRKPQLPPETIASPLLVRWSLCCGPRKPEAAIPSRAALEQTRPELSHVSSLRLPDKWLRP